jgi:hypothetical protein
MLFGFSRNSSHGMATLMSCDVMIHDDSERDTNSNVAMAINFIFINVTPPQLFSRLIYH